MNIPFFSIIIPLYNKQAEIERTLSCVLDQSFQDFEIIIVDDGSTDLSCNIVNSFHDSRIILIHKKNGGVSSARNVGIQNANGKYLSFLDADDEWDKDYLYEQKRMIEDFPQCKMWGINFVEVNKGNIVRYLPTGLPHSFRGVVEQYFGIKKRISDLFCSSSVIIEKSVFVKIRSFDERLKYGEDVDVWWRIICSYPVAFYDRYMVFYHFDASNRALNKDFELKNWVYFYPEKYADYKGNEPFYSWIQRSCAAHLKIKYFKSLDKSAVIAGRKLDFSVIPYKYRLYFRLPFFVSKIIYQILH